METSDRAIEERSRRAAAALTAAAEAEGLVDVGFGFADSPFGPLLVAVTPRGLVRLSYPDEDPDLELAEVARRVSPRILESPRATDEVRRELDQYFDGARTSFDVPVDLAGVEGF